MSDIKDGYNDFAHSCVRVLAARGLSPRSVGLTLDFGCGSGALVYALRDEGFDARGVEIYDFFKLRRPEDRSLFEILRPNDQLRDFQIDWRTTRLPYQDETFGLVVSSEVMEHVRDHDAVLRELARILRPGGIAIHSFPAKYRPVECHIGIPFGAQIRSRTYYRLCLALGLGMTKRATVTETASDYLRYVRDSLNYQSPSALTALASSYFVDSQFVPELWQVPNSRIDCLLRWRAARWLYTWSRRTVWVVQKSTSQVLIK